VLQGGAVWGALKIVLKPEERISRDHLLGFQVFEMVTIQLRELVPHLGEEVLGVVHDGVAIDDWEAGSDNVLELLM